MTLPLVSVITPTWQRHSMLLDRCIPSVQAQTYGRVEHIVVSDGPDPGLRESIAARTCDCANGMHRPIRFAELGGHDPAAHWGHHARLHGLELARGNLIAYLDDDDAYRPHHLATLAAALERNPDALWAYSLMEWRPDPPTVIGCDPPRCGQIGTPMFMHRRELAADWGPASAVEDWMVVERWLAAGAGYVFAGEVTVDVWPSSAR